MSEVSVITACDPPTLAVPSTLGSGGGDGGTTVCTQPYHSWSVFMTMAVTVNSVAPAG